MVGVTVGISAHYHDSAVSFIDNSSGEVLFAASEERFSRIKGDHSFPLQAITAGMSFLGKAKGDITRVGYYEKPIVKLSRILLSPAAQLHRGSHVQLLEIARQLGKRRYLPQFQLKRLFPGIPIDFHSHHMSHAASAFYASGFDEAVIVTADGVGEWDTLSISLGSKSGIKKLQSLKYPHSLGLFYATFTAYCGFKVNSGEYKLMGLAPYGKPIYSDLIKKYLIKEDSSGLIKLNMKYFAFNRSLYMFDEALCELLGGQHRNPEEEIDQRICDVAASAQAVLEEYYIRIIQRALEISMKRELCLSGGVALNCVANSKLLTTIEPDHIFIQPAAGDAGGSLGAAYLSLRNIKRNNSSVLMPPKISNVFLGVKYSNEVVEDFLISQQIPYQKFESMTELDNMISSLLMNRKIVAIFRGRSEFGPRALGARSVLADATDPTMQRRLNLSIKKRESFRPFAPIILLEQVHNWFKWPSGIESPYMLFTAEVADSELLKVKSSQSSVSLVDQLNSIRSRIPAVTHVDNSARIQTINELHPLRNVLNSYYSKSGSPVLINTSFNVRGEPIVESPTDAMNCFINTDIDYLAMENFLIDARAKTDSIKRLFKGTTFELD